ncbi:MAG: hypothetical protein KAJ05_07725, partial [Candidatus Latescibacteria bacterium]|nr:hypothetical protein [Candidatus Latescibacterota bacterium]
LRIAAFSSVKKPMTTDFKPTRINPTAQEQHLSATHSIRGYRVCPVNFEEHVSSTKVGEK